MEKSINKGLYNLRIWIIKKLRDQKAQNIIKKLEVENGRLSPDIRKDVKTYSVHTLGSKKYVPMLTIYATFNQEFKEGWIPDYYYETIVVPKSQGKYGQVSGLRCLNKLLFNSRYIPDILHFINGAWLSKEYKFISREQVVETISI